MKSLRMLFCHIKVSVFAYEKVRYMGKSYCCGETSSRGGSLGKYMAIYLHVILAGRKETNPYVTKQHSDI